MHDANARESRVVYDLPELQPSNVRVGVVIVIAAVLMIWRPCVWVQTLPERQKRGEFGSGRPVRLMDEGVPMRTPPG
jgi:hypothetical protein